MSPSGRGVLAALAVATVGTAALLASPSAVLAEVRAVLFGPWFPLVLAGLYLLRPFLAWPITVLSALVGFRYGLAVGIPVALVGAVATSLIPYAAARRFQTDRGLLGWASAGSTRFFGTTGHLRGVVVARLAPTPAEAVSAAAGVAGVSRGAFVLGTAVGEFPWTVAAVLLGSSMQEFSVSAIRVDPRLVAGTVLLALLLLAGPLCEYAYQKVSAQS